MATQGTFMFHLVPPQFLSVRSVRGKVLNILQRYGRLMVRDMNLTTLSWVKHQPQFFHIERYAGGNAQVFAGTDDQIWDYLNKGTQVRYATMTKGFVAKTTPGVIGSGAGRGGLAYVSKQVPRPGIKARGWTLLIKQRHDSAFMMEMSNAIASSIVPSKKP